MGGSLPVARSPSGGRRDTPAYLGRKNLCRNAVGIRFPAPAASSVCAVSTANGEELPGLPASDYCGASEISERWAPNRFRHALGAPYQAPTARRRTTRLAAARPALTGCATHEPRGMAVVSGSASIGN